MNFNTTVSKNVLKCGEISFQSSQILGNLSTYWLCVISARSSYLDCAKVTIGTRVMFGPNVQVGLKFNFFFDHPVDWALP